MQYNALSSFVCSEWLLCRLLASVTDCIWIQMSICPIMFCSILFPALCFFQHYVWFFVNWKEEEEALKHTNAAVVQQAIIHKEWNECVGVQIALWNTGWRSVNRRSCHFYEHLIHSFVWWTGGQCHCIYMHLAGRGFICLSEWFTTHRGTLAVHKMGTRG